MVQQFIGDIELKKYMIGFVIILSVLVGQDKYRFFLESDDNLKLAGEENYNIIKAELDKMLADYVSKIDLDNYWEVRNSERVFVRQERDLDAINAALEMDRALMAGMNIYEKKAHKDGELISSECWDRNGIKLEECY